MLFADPVWGQGVGRHCQGRAVITGTVLGQAQLERGLGRQATPALVQAAGLAAAVAEPQRVWAEAIVRQTLRTEGHFGGGGEEIFDLLLSEARAGQRSASAMRGLAGEVIGTVGGGLAGMLAGRMLGGEGIGGPAGMVGGALAGRSGMRDLLAGTMTQGIEIVTEERIVKPIVTRMLRAPCEISAAEALQSIRAGR